MRVKSRRTGSAKAKRNWSHVRLVFGLVVFFAVVSSVLLTWFIDLRVGPVVESWAQQRAVNIATRAISSAVEEIMAGQLETTNMVIFERDVQDRITAVRFDYGAINRIVSQTTNRIQDALNTMRDEVLPVPIGQITGIQFLAGWGPSIPVRILPVGAVDTTPKHEFLEQGINQTLYRIYLDVKTNIRVVVPLIARDVPVTSQVPLVETIIKGEVPAVYFNQTPELKELERLQPSDMR